MTAQIIDGRAVAAKLLDAITRETEQFILAHGRRPCLATVLVGDDPSSHTYVRMKRNRCAEVGMESRYVELPADTTTADLIAEVEALSVDATVDGILLQHPVPDHINERAAFEAITPGKDVDGVSMHSFAAMAFNEKGFHSCTPGGILRLLDAYEVPLAGQHAVVVGRSPILGKPVGMLLLARDATVTYCHSRTRDLADHVRDADIVIAAVGRPELIRGEWIKDGAVVIDAGYNPGNVGDVDYAGAAARARLITPVPGGVGPMTIAVLLEQTLAAAKSVVEMQCTSGTHRVTLTDPGCAVRRR
ncbi:bifunctional 5,10-methylenetetrahydrofolate dehydrogenase/5,10-methenyltetrahydrofolate cyclohydrolase [Prescottella agglutinans]|uniref:Bifunctional protein FolD n=1 Tax=Prescottella agglutinans TaxID=1644129 RepID=A0ABT6MIV8_9NOCA|nr:bifunctional 5,10-methylenetetrahydrofolate dehydrogenase/5,10-methenyltetrahydrofolate cyclohydrolase [Prescottella agglutinans]MDH6284253.1 methylenetetrahydrofolate dehydrogenase (NADP+)/methenyltetrahydrofolate cyclohydrolase [Prescottella agglutinans]